MASGASPWRALKTAIDMTAHAIDEGVRAGQRKARLEMIEFRRALLRGCGIRKKQHS